MQLLQKQERRQNRRYIVRGKASVRSRWRQLEAEVVNFSQKGMLIRARRRLPEGMQAHFHIELEQFAAPLDVEGTVVGGTHSVSAICFKEESDAIRRVIEHLERENISWTGAVHFNQDAAKEPAQPDQDKHEPWQDYIYRNG